MNHPSELELFLEERRDGGRPDSEGEFSLSGQVALEKLAKFQLPFPTAWVLKVVQCAVREGAVASINVELSAREASFFFHTRSFDLDEVEAAFTTPELSSNAGLRHLVSALWAVGVHQKRPFKLALPKGSESLIWDGRRLHRAPVCKPVMKTSLVVSLNQQRGGGWLSGVMRSADFNAEILNSLKRWCYTCTVPLIVDGRRMDSLQACWGHGWGPKTCPLALGFAKAEVPDLLLSPGTFEKKPSTAERNTPMGDGRRALDRVSPKQVASVPFLVTYHHEPSSVTAPEPGRRLPCESLIYWVQDGVVVQTEPLIADKSTTTVGCFVNAEGLETDLTTLNLRETPERKSRKDLIPTAIEEALRELSVLDESMEELAESARHTGSWGQKMFFLAGFGAFWVSPVAGLFLTGLAWLSGKYSGADIEERNRRYSEEIAELLELLRHSS